MSAEGQRRITGLYIGRHRRRRRGARTVRMLLRHGPPQITRVLVRGLLRRRPATFGLVESKTDEVAAGLRLAFDDLAPAVISERVDAWIDNWADGLACAAIGVTRGPGAGVHTVEVVGPPLSGSCVVAYMHSVLDPLPPIALMTEHALDSWWIGFPIGGRDDLRSAWLDYVDAPAGLEERVVSVLAPDWLARTIGLVRGGAVAIVAIETPFRSRRGPQSELKLGGLSIPVARALSLLSRATPDTRLCLAVTTKEAAGRWCTRVTTVSTVDELLTSAEAWLAASHLVWSAWSTATGIAPDITDVRRHVADRLADGTYVTGG